MYLLHRRDRGHFHRLIDLNDTNSEIIIVICERHLFNFVNIFFPHLLSLYVMYYVYRAFVEGDGDGGVCL